MSISVYENITPGLKTRTAARRAGLRPWTATVLTRRALTTPRINTTRRISTARRIPISRKIPISLRILTLLRILTSLKILTSPRILTTRRIFTILRILIIPRIPIAVIILTTLTTRLRLRCTLEDRPYQTYQLMIMLNIGKFINLIK